jgi:hypothetical protein
MYFDDPKLSCSMKEVFQDITGKITECRTYFASMAIGWLMALSFLFTTIISIWLWTQRDKIRNQLTRNEKDDDDDDDDDDDVPYPHPDNPVV